MAPDGDDEPSLLLQTLAKLFDVSVNSPAVPLEIQPPDSRQEMFSGKCLSRVLRQKIKEIKLFRCQRNSLSAQEHPATIRINPELTNGKP
ncbi:hypothetical protein SDC9_128429 [bioreactor metagenome]|uniref:Uncharacterized protein n=1 Tax=bioreactor metagenome TaxID=1076179 RepID=A0A645CW65_9ZZZZ